MSLTRVSACASRHRGYRHEVCRQDARLSLRSSNSLCEGATQNYHNISASIRAICRISQKSPI